MERERAYSARLREKIEKVWNECLPFSSHVTEPMRLYFKNRELLFKVDESRKNRLSAVQSGYGLLRRRWQ